MARLLNFDDIFAELMSGEVVVIPFPTRKNFECLRVSLTRRVKRYRESILDLGGEDPLEGKVLRSNCREIPDEERDTKDNILQFKGEFKLILPAEKKVWKVDSL